MVPYIEPVVLPSIQTIQSAVIYVHGPPPQVQLKTTPANLMGIVALGLGLEVEEIAEQILVDFKKCLTETDKI